MSTIAIATIFIPKTYGPNDLVLIDDILTKWCDEVKGTKKGRFWETVKDNSVFTVDVRPTESKLLDYEDELLELDLLPEDVPETISIVSNNLSSDRDSNYYFVKLLADEIVNKLDGISNGARYRS